MKSIYIFASQGLHEPTSLIFPSNKLPRSFDSVAPSLAPGDSMNGLQVANQEVWWREREE